MKHWHRSLCLVMWSAHTQWSDSVSTNWVVNIERFSTVQEKNKIKMLDIRSAVTKRRTFNIGLTSCSKGLHRQIASYLQVCDKLCRAAGLPLIALPFLHQSRTGRCLNSTEEMSFPQQGCNPTEKMHFSGWLWSQTHPWTITTIWSAWTTAYG